MGERPAVLVLATSRKAGRGASKAKSTAAIAGNDRLVGLLELSTLLSSERGVYKLLRILTVESSRLLESDRATIFLYDDKTDEIYSYIAMGEQAREIRFPARKGVAGRVIQSKKLLNIPDAYACPHFNRAIDRKTGYRTRTILAMPMLKRNGSVMGVMQILNSKNGRFSREDEQVIGTIAGLAGVTFENAILMEQQARLFESFVESSVRALGERDSVTYGHTLRVAHYTEVIARAVHDEAEGPFAAVRFDADHILKLRYAALLHDIGKIGVPENVLNKRDKLDEQQLELIRLRFEAVRITERTQARNREARDRIDAELNLGFEAVLRSVRPGPMSGEDEKLIEALHKRKFSLNGSRERLINRHEFENLSVRRGNLTAGEFDVMKSHVSKTREILDKIDWPEGFENVPKWAASHHERPNGTGYPDGLKGKQIPLEGQILAIADIFDALTATDRPYKKKIPLNVTLKILQEEAGRNNVNADIVKLFLDRELFEKTPPPELCTGVVS